MTHCRTGSDSDRVTPEIGSDRVASDRVTHEIASDRVTPGINTILPLLKGTGGIVLMLLCVQFATGMFLAFYYVPSVDHAHTTVSFIEKVLSSGSWIRSLHHYGSQWLPLFLFLHLIRLLWCEAFKYWKTQWIAAVVLLGLVMAAGATGYSLPWDARAFFSTRIAEGLVASLPLLGRNARLWLLGGNDISTLTLSRFFALHVLVTPFLIVTVVGWRLVYQSAKGICWSTVNRNAIAAGLVFIALSIWTLKFHAPLGPAVSEVSTDYLPRPGGQFLWLYQSLKYVPGALGSFVGIVIPGVALVVLLVLPWLDFAVLRKVSTQPQRAIASLILGGAALWIATMTTTSYLSDRRDPRIRQQLAKQDAQEKTFRTLPFQPAVLKLNADIGNTVQDQTGAPPAFTRLCANCHGSHGEGGRQGTLKFPPLIGVASKPRRTVEDIIRLLNDPTAYGIEPPMRSFATKLTDQEKRDIAEWILKLK
jgi:ubiquinol-cytochrome c reductase cytochrome b subunit